MTTGNLMRSRGTPELLEQPVLLSAGLTAKGHPPSPPPAGQWISDTELENLKRGWMEDGRRRGREEARAEAKEDITKAAEAAASAKLDQALKAHQEATSKEQSEKWRHLAQALAGQMQGLREDLRAQVSEWTMIACTRLLGQQVEASVADVIRHVLDEVDLDGPLKVLLHPSDLSVVSAAREASLEAWPPELTFLASDRVSMGGCLLQSAAQTLDARLEVQLEMLRAALDVARQRQHQSES